MAIWEWTRPAPSLPRSFDNRRPWFEIQSDLVHRGFWLGLVFVLVAFGVMFAIDLHRQQKKHERGLEQGTKE